MSWILMYRHVEPYQACRDLSTPHEHSGIHPGSHSTWISILDSISWGLISHLKYNTQKQKNSILLPSVSLSTRLVNLSVIINSAEPPGFRLTGSPRGWVHVFLYSSEAFFDASEYRFHSVRPWTPQRQSSTILFVMIYYLLINNTNLSRF